MNFTVERKIDKLGRIVIPKDFRKALGVDIDTDVSIRLTDGIIIITPVKHEVEGKNIDKG